MRKHEIEVSRSIGFNRFPGNVFRGKGENDLFFIVDRFRKTGDQIFRLHIISRRVGRENRKAPHVFLKREFSRAGDRNGKEFISLFHSDVKTEVGSSSARKRQNDIERTLLDLRIARGVRPEGKPVARIGITGVSLFLFQAQNVIRTQEKATARQPPGAFLSLCGSCRFSE